MKKLLLLIFFYLSFLSSIASDIEFEGLCYNLDPVNRTLTFCGRSIDYKRSEINIPAYIEYNGQSLPVVSISENAFPSGYKAPTKLIIPATVRTIEPKAFPYSCPITDIIISDSDDALSMGYGYFSPKTTTHVSYQCGTFYYCKLNSIYIGRPLQYSYLYNEEPTNSTTPFKEAGYLSGNSIVEVKFGPNVHEIPYMLFGYCKQLSNLILTDNITSIGGYAFTNCPITNDFTIPSKICDVPDEAFQGIISRIINLDSDNLIEIGDRAFQGVNGKSNTEKIILGKNISQIGKDAFSHQSNVKEIICHNPIPPIIHAETADEFVPNIVYANATLLVPSSSLDKYKSSDIWKFFWNIEGFEDAGIEEIQVDKNSYRIYDVNGLELRNLQQGINIIVYTDGSTQKLLVK